MLKQVSLQKTPGLAILYIIGDSTTESQTTQVCLFLSSTKHICSFLRLLTVLHLAITSELRKKTQPIVAFCAAVNSLSTTSQKPKTNVFLLHNNNRDRNWHCLPLLKGRKRPLNSCMYTAGYPSPPPNAMLFHYMVTLLHFGRVPLRFYSNNLFG